MFVFSILLKLIGITTQAHGNEQKSTVQKQLADLEASSRGRLGVAVTNTENNQEIEYQVNEYSPMGCTFKVIGVAAILKKSMKEQQLLHEKIIYGKKVLTNWAPITEKHL